MSHAPYRIWAAPARWRLFVSAFLLSLCLSSVVLGAFGALSDIFTDHRLMPLFLLRDRLPLYLDPNHGPMLSTLYPPLSVLLYAPAAVFQSPAPAFLTAGLLAQLFCFAPLLLALWLSPTFADPDALFRMLLVGAGFVLWCNLSEVMATVYMVHADAPALLLTSLGLLLFIAYTRTPDQRLIILSALFASLAPWAKQTAAPAVVIVPLFLVLRRQYRGLAIYILTLMGAEAILLGIWHWAFDLKQMFTWLFAIPARHPWKSVWSTAIDGANRVLLRENLAALTILGSTLVFSVSRRDDGKKALARTLSQPWAVFTVAGLLLWPISVLGFVKVGGAYNTLLYSTYFLNCALAALTFEALSASNFPGARRIHFALAAFLCAASVPMVITMAKSVLSPKRFLRSANIEAYRMCLQSPGEVYFPWHPLSVYLAERHLYHFELGVFDRTGAGIEIDPKNFAAYLPPKMQYVAYTGTPPTHTLELLPEFTRPVELPQLPGWVVYARK